MKTSPLLVVLLVGTGALSSAARAEEPVPAKLTPEVQSAVAELWKELAQFDPNAQPEAEPAPLPAAPSARPSVTPAVPSSTLATREAKAPLGANSSLKSSGLTSGGLSSGRLAPSAGLGGSGTSGGPARLSANEWRQLFPSRTDRR